MLSMLPRTNNFGMSLFDDMNSMFDTPFFRNVQTAPAMKTDIKEKDGLYLMTMDLPGFNKDNIKIELKDGYLTVTAEQKEVIKKDIQTFLNNMFGAMNMEVKADITFDDEENSVNVDLSGDNMGVLIGKRGQTLDSIQYLTSLVINKNSEKYVRVKLDTENYRKRRKETLESLAKNIAYKVKRSRRPVSLEPMNPYERRIIHSALQADKFVSTRSEGEEPFRHVVVYLERENNNRYNR